MVGAAGGFVATTDALEKGNHLIRGAPCHQLGYALGFAVTASVKEAVTDATFIVQLYVNEFATCAVTSVKHKIRF